VTEEPVLAVAGLRSGTVLRAPLSKVKQAWQRPLAGI